MYQRVVYIIPGYIKYGLWETIELIKLNEKNHLKQNFNGISNFNKDQMECDIFYSEF